MDTNNNHKQVEIVFACLILDYPFYAIVKQFKAQFGLGLFDAAKEVRETIKTMAKSGDYKAITYCYQNQIAY